MRYVSSKEALTTAGAKSFQVPIAMLAKSFTYSGPVCTTVGSGASYCWQEWVCRFLGVHMTAKQHMAAQ